MSKKNREQTRREQAEAALRAQRAEERRRTLLLGGGIAVLLVAVVVIGLLVQRGRDDTGEEATPPAGITEGHGLAIGERDAPRQVVIYEDFLCPFCAALETRSREGLEELAADGQVYVEFRPVDYLGRYGDWSMRSMNAFAAVLDTAGPEVAKDFHDALFDAQPSESGPFPSDDALVDLAVEAGADEAAVRGPIEDLAFEQWVRNASDDASQLGVAGTPTVLVDGEQFESGDSIEQMADDLVAELR